MGKRSSIATGAAIKHLLRMVRHPWILGKLAKLQTEKWLFNVLYPNAHHGQARKIRQVSIRITDICNLRCITCGQWGPTGFLHGRDLKELKRSEISLTRYKEIFVDLVAHEHRPIVYLWGGEPTLYDGWLDLIEYCTKFGLPTAVATNGTRLAPYAKHLVKAPMFLLQISIDGHNAELHNRIRPGVGSTNSFEAIQQGLAAVQEERARINCDLPIIASLTTISKENCYHLVDIYEAYRDKVDLFIFYPAWWVDEESAKVHEQDFARRFGFRPELHRGWIGGWVPDDYEALNTQLIELNACSRSWNSPPIIFIPDITGIANLKKYYTDHSSLFGYAQCVSIFQVVEIDSNGNLSPCRDYHDYIVGNICDNTITELWNSEAYRKFRRSLVTEGLMPICSRCCGLMGY
ncbi:putative Radical SAM domain protein [Desulfovibrionales bacterium]